MRAGCGARPAGLGGAHRPPPVTPSIGHNEVIGVCRVGPDAADPHGREHWAEMLANPRKPVEHWHQLVEVSGAPLTPSFPQPLMSSWAAQSQVRVPAPPSLAV